MSGVYSRNRLDSWARNFPDFLTRNQPCGVRALGKQGVGLITSLISGTLLSRVYYISLTRTQQEQVFRSNAANNTVQITACSSLALVKSLFRYAHRYRQTSLR